MSFLPLGVQKEMHMKKVDEGIKFLTQKIQDYNEGQKEGLVKFLDRSETLVLQTSDDYPCKSIYFTLKYRMKKFKKVILSDNQIKSLILGLYTSASKG